MKTLALRWLCLLLVFLTGAATPARSAGDCSIDAVFLDVRASLVGTIEVSTVRIEWWSSHEGPDVNHYEVWARSGSSAVRLDTQRARWSCPLRTERVSTVPYNPALAYFVEIHGNDGTVRAVRLTRIN